MQHAVEGAFERDRKEVVQEGLNCVLQEELEVTCLSEYVVPCLSYHFSACPTFIINTYLGLLTTDIKEVSATRAFPRAA